jgi:mRNA-degrading endonuclease toxin of MazEF toxin-antitoxin module
MQTHFRPGIIIGRDSTKVLVEQLVAIDARRASETVGRVTIEEMWAIDEALSLVVGLH